MASRSITFQFDKQAGEQRVTFLRADEGSARVQVKNDPICLAMATLFDKLIVRDKALFKPHLSALTAFSVTLIEDPQLSHPSLIIEPLEEDQPIIYLKKLKKETADLFFKSMIGSRAAPFKPNTSIPAALPPKPSPAPQEAAVIAATPIPVSTAVPLPTISSQTKAGDQGVLPPINSAVTGAPLMTAVQADDEGFSLVADAPAAKPEAALPTKKIAEDPMYTALFVKMIECFMMTTVVGPNQIGHDFGTYLMRRLFDGATAYDYKDETADFTMTFDQPRTFNLTNLPKKISDQAKKGLKQLQNSVLTIPKKVKGRFVGNKLTFDPGALTISWPKDWIGADAQLLEIYNTKNETIAMVISCGKSLARKSITVYVAAQDFADFVECNYSN
jgi:hypothetical protein